SSGDLAVTEWGLPMSTPRSTLTFPCSLALLLTLGLATTRSADASPQFAAPFLSFDVGRLPQSIAIGDLNGDGTPDLVAASPDDHSVSVLLGNGDGTFAERVERHVIGDPYCVVIGDMNGDGKLDVVTANREGYSVSVLFGNGDGTFQETGITIPGA